MTKSIDYRAVLRRAKMTLETSDTMPIIIIRRETMTIAELATGEVTDTMWQEAMDAFHATKRRAMN